MKVRATTRPKREPIGGVPSSARTNRSARTERLAGARPGAEGDARPPRRPERGLLLGRSGSVEVADPRRIAHDPGTPGAWAGRSRPCPPSGPPCRPGRSTGSRRTSGSPSSRCRSETSPRGAGPPAPGCRLRDGRGRLGQSAEFAAPLYPSPWASSSNRTRRSGAGGSSGAEAQPLDRHRRRAEVATPGRSGHVASWRGSSRSCSRSRGSRGWPSLPVDQVDPVDDPLEAGRAASPSPMTQESARELGLDRIGRTRPRTGAGRTGLAGVAWS